MKWRDRTFDWKKRFAFLPVTVGGEVIWLETYWARPGGEYTEVSFTDPSLTPKPEGGQS